MKSTTLVKTNRVSRMSMRALLAVAFAMGCAPLVSGPSACAQATSQPATQDADRSDANIQSDVAYAISHSQALAGQQITAATIDGDVTLSGNVKDAASKELAESLVYRVNGVRSVTNNLTIGPGAENQAPSAENEAQPAPQDQNPGYDPAQQNMAQAAPDDQSQNQAAAPPVAQYPVQPQQPAPPPQPAAPPAVQVPVNEPVTIPEGTLVQVRTSEPLDASRLQAGAFFQGTAANDVYAGGVLAIPRGAVIQGRVVDRKSNGGGLTGSQGLSLQLTTLDLGGRSYSLASDTWSGQGPGKGGYSAANTVGAAGVGAVIGAIAGRGVGAAIGAGVGGAVGAAGSALSNGPRFVLPPEAVINFHLTEPLTVTPVSMQEAQKLASSQPGPQLRPRPYASPYPYAGYAPPPPPPGYYYYGPYYRPYPVYYGPRFYYYRY